MPEQEKNAQEKVIVFSVGGQDYCIPVLSVREIRSYEEPTKLPFAAHYVKGAFNLRGVILTIVDLAALLGLTPEDQATTRIVIVVDVQDKLCGLVVDKVIDMTDVDLSTMQNITDCDNISGMCIIADRMTGAINLQSIMNAISF